MFLYFHHIKCFWFCNFSWRLTPILYWQHRCWGIQTSRYFSCSAARRSRSSSPPVCRGLPYCGAKLRGLDAWCSRYASGGDLTTWSASYRGSFCLYEPFSPLSSQDFSMLSWTSLMSWYRYVEAMSFHFWYFGLRTHFVKTNFDRYIYIHGSYRLTLHVCTF